MLSRKCAIPTARLKSWRAGLLAPALVQTPNPPIRVGATTDAALRRASVYGMENMKERIATYRRFSDEAGRLRGTVVIIRNAFTAATRAEVEWDWLPGLIETHLFNRAITARPELNMPDPDGLYARREAGKSVDLSVFTRERAIAGSPERLADTLSYVFRHRNPFQEHHEST